MAVDPGMGRSLSIPNGGAAIELSSPKDEKDICSLSETMDSDG